ncbi:MULTISPECIES: GNAT family N-acetyltransferase [Streptomyces]|uniref:GNAT family N-acetyltransferase n=1 Tax=Streptomyces edwardsiae TaxID=3075527 RepID=A0ABU2Q806_9ACTN|nr:MULTISPECIES: GNAT family N-acetyltransferase [unclassified Streptomyces]MDT0400572.1 GNAT family N-acetyltransferase [Streptomyces sp. DSM 41635]
MHTVPITPVRLTAGPLILRPWAPEDAAVLAALYDDAALRRWASAPVHDGPSAARWLAEQRHGWETGERLAFAVEEDARPAGHVVLKRPASTAATAEVGYWTAAHARGRGVAPRALRALADWAFTTFARDGLTRLDLLHQVDNTASCRVAEKSGFALLGLLPAAPPDFPLDGHLHIREAPRAT